jgi:replicative DNA helicase
MNIIPQKWDPVDISSEQAVLGSIMVSPETFAKVSTVLEAEHFFDDIHRQIYRDSFDPDRGTASWSAC